MATGNIISPGALRAASKAAYSTDLNATGYSSVILTPKSSFYGFLFWASTGQSLLAIIYNRPNGLTRVDVIKSISTLTIEESPDKNGVIIKNTGGGKTLNAIGVFDGSGEPWTVEPYVES